MSGSMKNNYHFWQSDQHHDRHGIQWLCRNRRQHAMLPSQVLFGAHSQSLCKCFVCLLAKQHTALNWKYAISRFHTLPGNAEALVGWGGKIKITLWLLTFSVTFLSKIIAISRWIPKLRQAKMKQCIHLYIIYFRLFKQSVLVSFKKYYSTICFLFLTHYVHL